VDDPPPLDQKLKGGRLDVVTGWLLTFRTGERSHVGYGEVLSNAAGFSHRRKAVSEILGDYLRVIRWQERIGPSLGSI
jgi:hypothetical protein